MSEDSYRRPMSMLCLSCVMLMEFLIPGYSHSSRSPLFSIGSTVSEGVREFAETGSTDTLDQEAANITFLDTIISPPIEQGVGDTSTNIFVDTNHTMVSFEGIFHGERKKLVFF